MNEQTFCDTAQAHRKLLYHVAYTNLRNDQACEDAVQEALLKAWERRATLRKQEGFKYWLVRILSNTCHDMLRRHRRSEDTAIRLLDTQRDMDPNASDLILNQALHDALGQLPLDLRLPIILYYLEDFPVAEIARLQKRPEGTIRNRLHRARQQLKTYLGEEEPI